MPVRFGEWGRGRRWEGDGCWGLQRVVHRQDKPRAADRHVSLRRVQLTIPAIFERPGAGVLGVDGAGPGCVGADGDVGVHGADVGVVQDEVGVIVVKRPFVLKAGKVKCADYSKPKDISVFLAGYFFQTIKFKTL